MSDLFQGSTALVNINIQNNKGKVFFRNILSGKKNSLDEVRTRTVALRLNLKLNIGSIRNGNPFVVLSSVVGLLATAKISLADT